MQTNTTDTQHSLSFEILFEWFFFSALKAFKHNFAHFKKCHKTETHEFKMKYGGETVIKMKACTLKVI